MTYYGADGGFGYATRASGMAASEIREALGSLQADIFCPINRCKGRPPNDQRLII
jgi:hypothetical protein